MRLKIRLAGCLAAWAVGLVLMPLDGAAEEPRAFFSSPESFEIIARAEFKGLARDFSDVVFMPDTGNLMVVDDECSLFEMSAETGKIVLRRTVKLLGLKDCEAAAVLPDQGAGDRIGIAEERRGRLAVFTLDSKASAVDCRRECTFYPVDRVTTFWRQNSGLEAMTVDKTGAQPVIYFGKEEHPKKIYRAVMDAQGLQISQPWDAEKLLPQSSDIAGMEYFEGALFLLDERREMVRQVHPSSGQVISSFQLPPRPWVIGHRYEGIALMKKPDSVWMAVAAEKNEILLFRRKNG